MASTEILSLAVAAESTYASVDSTTGVPSTSGLSFAEAEVERAGLAPFGDMPVRQRAETRAGGYNLPPEPVSSLASGTRLHKRSGTFTITMPLRTIGDGTAYATYPASPLGRLLASGMAVGSIGTVGSSNASSGAGTITVTSSTNFAVGFGVGATISGRKEVSFITEITNGTTIVVSPQFTAAPSALREMQTYWMDLPISPGASVCCRLTTSTSIYYAYGCRWSQARIFFDNRMGMIEFTMQSPYIVDDNGGGTPADPVRASGAVAHLLESYVQIGENDIGSTTPASVPSNPLSVDSVEVTFSNTLTEVGRTSDNVGISNLEITGVNATFNIVLSTPFADIDEWMLDQERHSVLIGMGPTGNGNGAAIYFPGAVLTQDPSKRDHSGGIVRQVLVGTQGLWSLDTGSKSTSVPINTPVRLALAS